MPAGTGLWLNNCLGELELNRRGLDAGPVGARLPSNMAPTVCRPIDERSSRVMAVGSPGADRITTALAQALVNHFKFGWPLDRAIGHPRLHVDTSGDEDRLMIDVPATTLPQTVTEKRTMYFGGVSAALYEGAREDHFTVAADPRREGGTAISNTA